MKWMILIISVALMSGCYYATDVVEYRRVVPVVQPVAVYSYPTIYTYPAVYTYPTVGVTSATIWY